MTSFVTAPTASTRPAPTRSGPKIGPSGPGCEYTGWVAVFMMTALTCCGVHVGCAARTSAAMPATCGEAIDVPVSVVGIDPVPEAAEEIRVPGAATSGLTTPSEPCAPREEPGLSV